MLKITSAGKEIEIEELSTKQLSSLHNVLDLMDGNFTISEISEKAGIALEELKEWTTSLEEARIIFALHNLHHLVHDQSKNPQLQRPFFNYENEQINSSHTNTVEGFEYLDDRQTTKVFSGESIGYQHLTNIVKLLPESSIDKYPSAGGLYPIRSNIISINPNGSLETGIYDYHLNLINHNIENAIL